MTTVQIKHQVLDDNRLSRFETLVDKLFESRKHSIALVEPLSDEDQVVQAMDDASPAKWHLAHTTWFYESFILRDFLPGYEPFSEAFEYCFNSYYESKGERHPRCYRGLLTRPSAQEVRDYREHVDHALKRLVDYAFDDNETTLIVFRLIELGINHEQQHQELLLTDILALFANQPLKPAYQSVRPPENALKEEILAQDWIQFPGGVCQIGHSGNAFSYDNEGPRHHVLAHPFKISNRCVTNGEWLAFMKDGGYLDPMHWLADGWRTVQDNYWIAPEYWEQKNGEWHQMTLEGLLPIDPGVPVCHVSYYEADAFARWAGKRLPNEFEWEIAVQGLETNVGNRLGGGCLRPSVALKMSEGQPSQMFGDVWQWTRSAYQPYPGYKPAEGAVGEYNGKFMCSQQVLRGASCVTADGHSRSTYRNFFYPFQRWQFSGLRLAEDCS